MKNINIFTTTPEDLQIEVNKRRWYHKIDLGHGVITPGYDFDVLWDNIRAVRAGVNFDDKRVLDLGSFDGMWAFEAENLGASLVVATDCDMRFDNFFFCKQVLGSKVEPYYNVSPHTLTSSLDSVLTPWDSDPGTKENYRFDIVQHLGLLYHLTDPMSSLFQARAVMKRGGKLLIETAAVINETEKSYMLFNGRPPKDAAGPWAHVYNDPTTWWAPTIPCLYELLSAALFEVDKSSLKILPQNGDIGRVCLIASAMAPENAHPDHIRELYYSYRIPGVDFEKF